MNDPRKPRGRGKKCHEGTFCKKSEPAFEKLVLDANITLYTDPGYLAGANLNIVSIRQIIPAVKFNISLDLNPPAIRLDVFFLFLQPLTPLRHTMMPLYSWLSIFLFIPTEMSNEPQASLTH